MQIGKKILIAKITLLTIFVVFSLIIQFKIIMPGFINLERHEAIKDIKRSVAALKSEVKHLDNLNWDWAAWDDTYNFVNDHNEEYIESNLVDSSFSDNDINMIFILDIKGKVVWGKSFDLEKEEYFNIPEFPATAFPQNHPLLGLDSVTDFRSGIIITSQGPMMISARPILTSNVKGPPRGTIIMGRLLDTGYIEKLAEQTQTEMSFLEIRSDSFPEEYKEMLDSLVDKNQINISNNSNSKLDVFTLLEDIQNTPALLIKLEVHRDISARGRAISLYSFWLNIFTGIVLTMIFLYLLSKYLVNPLQLMAQHISSVGKSYDLLQTINVSGCSEIDVIAREFNNMSESLANNRSEVINQSFHSGMSEITSGVIHNVRNTINPLVADIALLKENIKEITAENMATAFEELNDEKVDPDRKNKLTSFLELSLKHLVIFKKSHTKKLSMLTEQTQMTTTLLNDLEEFAHAGFVPDKFTIKQLVDDSTALFHNRFPDISMDIDLGTLETLNSHRSVLVLVFMNLFYNAGDSISAAGNTDGKIEISVKPEIIKGLNYAHFTIKDNGKGITANDLPHIFERGFSTKGKKISGVGLHWCSNTLKTLRGKLVAESDGPGSGASFHVLLPIDIAISGVTSE